MNDISLQNVKNMEDEDSDDEFWDLVTCSVGYMATYFYAYVHKNPCMTSYQTGERWMMELLVGHEKRCYNMFRMDPITFRKLCVDLEIKYGLKPSNNISVLEKVGMFVYTLSKGASNRDVQERFQHSGETVSRIFREVLTAMEGFQKDMIKPKDPEFREVSPKLANDKRYMPFLKDCIGAIDGTHIQVVVSEEDQLRYRGRKGVPTTNVMAVCDFDLRFTYVLSGWEGSAHDSRIFLSTIGSSRFNFPKPPPGKYYVGDKGYPEREGLLTPYPNIRYHLNDYRSRAPSGAKEVFNRAHSSIRSCIERAFGVLKAQWKVLQLVPRYSKGVQNIVIVSAFALHNYIRENSNNDRAFQIVDEFPDFIPFSSSRNVDNDLPNDIQLLDKGPMSATRNEIANALVRARGRCNQRSSATGTS